MIQFSQVTRLKKRIDKFTDIYISADCASYPCCCDIADRRNPADIISAVSCMVRSCNCSERNSYPAIWDLHSSDSALCRVC